MSHHFFGEWQQDGLGLGVGLDGFAAALTADARLPVATEPGVRLELVAVDPHRAGAQSLSNWMATRAARRLRCTS